MSTSRNHLLDIDGTMGEGGGQVLRSSLTLSMLTGKPFRLFNIRAGRDKPGLRPQHLIAVRSAARISNGIVRGDRVGSGEISFEPGPVNPGDFRFDIGTAGATSLVIQTLLPPLALANTSSTISVEGGTHVPWSPCFHYLDWNWRPFMERIGLVFDLELQMAGFYPRGGGLVSVTITGGSSVRPMTLVDRGRLIGVRGLSAVADLPDEIAERQHRQAIKRLGQLVGDTRIDIEVSSLPTRSRGTLLLLLAEFEKSQACFFALGARGKRAETVADEAIDYLEEFLATDATVDRWMADQLLLPLALSDGRSEFITSRVTQHLITNAEVIRLFLPARIRIEGASGETGMVSIEQRV